jgi:hypothetical protein
MLVTIDFTLFVLYNKNCGKKLLVLDSYLDTILLSVRRLTAADIVEKFGLDVQKARTPIFTLFPTKFREDTPSAPRGFDFPGGNAGYSGWFSHWQRFDNRTVGLQSCKTVGVA